MSKREQPVGLPCRPWVLRNLPHRIRELIYARLYRDRAASRPELFESAELEFARGVRLALHPTDEGHGQIAYIGFYEREASKHLVALAKKGGVLIDVGANFGYFSCLWAAQREDNTAIAFEASPSVFVELEANVTRNNFAARIACVQMAASDASGTVSFAPTSKVQTGWGGIALDAGGDTVQVQATRLDDYIRSAGITFINVLKIDTEGADAWVLEGTRKTLQERRIGDVFFEENRPRMASLGISVGSAATLLRECGYEIKETSRDDGMLQNFRAFRK